MPNPNLTAQTQRNYFDKQVSSYIYCLDEKKTVKIFLSQKFNIEYHNDEILEQLIKKYKKLNISAANIIPNLEHFITGLDKSVTRIRFELGICCDEAFNLHRLPCYLTTLSIICSKLLVPLDNLPQTLRKLQIKSGRTYDYPLDFLPFLLQSLHIDTKYNLPLNNLPPNLKLLQIQEIEEPDTLNNLPPNLKVLSIVEFYPYQFCNLPESLEEIAFPTRKIINYNTYVHYEYEKEFKCDYPNVKRLTNVIRSFSLDD
jgi:hypothetical protein